ncbi:gp58-like family protein [Leuconostoc mesenteroides]|uniref:gp58-like family protein n=1 Tax=Leuconostoc mesenteroides TaxID=1245 RepID=UPI00235E5D7F|nr:gp58-like family protein [Leuconostoc mesenteroides]
MGNVAVYKKGTTDFFSQGLGLLSDVVSSNLTQTVSSTGNVGQKLEVEYPIDGYIVSELVEGAILRVSVSTDKSDYGVFEIVDTLKDDSGTITVYGDPYYNRILRMSFDNGGVFTKFSSVQSALNAAKQNITGFPADFNLTSNLNTSVDLSEKTYDTFGTFLEALNSAVHGNIKYSLNSIQIYSALGKDITDITLRDDMNTSSVKITTDFSGIINKVIPVLPVLDKDGNATDQTKVGTIVTSKYSNQFLDYWAGKVIKFDTQDLANTYFERTKADRPVHTVDVNPIGLDDDFSTINIFDTIELYSTRLDYTDKLRVSERVFDTLAENVTSFKLGSSSVNIFNQINEQNNEIFNNIVKLTNAAISANGKGIDYFGQAQPSSPKEGNTWFWDDGTDFGIKQYTNGEWIDLAGSNTAEKISAAVNDAVSQAKSHTDEVKQGLSSDIATAKSQAASLANAAEANAKSAATSQFTQAQNALSDAKTDLTKSIASEASERTQAVAAANSQAQGYVNQAKDDALNTIAKEVTNRQNAVSALDTKATNAINQAKSDINDTINAISVGGRNLYITATQVAGYINGADGTVITTNGINKEMASDYIAVLPNTAYTFQAWGSLLSGKQYWAGIGQYDSNKSFLNRSAGVYGAPTVTADIPNDYEKTTFTTSANTYFVRISSRTYSNYRVKFEQGNLPTDWLPAPEDVVLDYTTKDNQIKETITQYKDANDGKVTKAQTDATTALGLVATKVSQTDYDTKTGDLSTKYTQVKQTVDSQATDIVDIKKTATSQASKINSISSDVDGTKQSISNIKKTQDSQSDKVNQITNDVNGTKQSITDIQTKDGKQDARMGTIETSVSGVKSEFSSYKTANDGVVKTAQTTAQAAVDGLKTKVSQTDYNAKTGQLQTDLTTTTQTANQAKTDIVSIKQKDGDQDSRMNTIESDASGTKQTVSQLQTVQGQQSGSISTLQQRADGFEATVTKVNNLAVGGRNYVLNSNVSTTGNITGFYSSVPSSYFSNKKLTVSVQLDYDNITALSGLKRLGVEFVILNKDGSNRYIGYWKYPAIGDSFHGRIYTTFDFSNNEFKDYANNQMGQGIYVQGVIGTNVSVSKPKLEIGTITDWTPAPEDLSGAIAKVKITADDASAAVTKLTSADGIITKAQADIKANADAITQKVSKTVYDQNTGDLTQSISKAQSTAEGAVSTVGDYKTSNDKRVEAAESKIEQNSRDITARVSKTDYDNNNSQLNTRFTKVEATANGASTTVGKLKTTVNNLGQINRLLNTEFNPDYAAWTAYGNVTTLSIDRYWLQNGSNNLGVNRNQDQSNYGYAIQKIAIGQNTTFSFSVNAKINSMISSKGRLYIHLRALDVKGNMISDIYKSGDRSTTINFESFSVQNAQTPAGTTVVELAIGMYGGGSISFNHPFFVLDSHIGNYVAGNYSNSDYLAQVKITADNISNFVRDASGNISSDFQTALSRTSIITGSTLASSIQKQTITQISSAITDNNGKIISLINQDTSGVQISGKNLAITADTTVDGNFWAKQVNAVQVNASNITVGTLNGNQVNITNINANNIVSGAISGANLNINLNTGQVQFQKGRIFKSDYTTDINIDQGYISTADKDTRVLLKGGQMQFVDPNVFDLQNTPYLKVYNGGGGNSFAGANLSGRDYIALYNSKNPSNVFNTPVGAETFSGISTGQDNRGNWLPTKVGGADRGVIIAGGRTDGWLIVRRSPYIFVGSGADGSSAYGNRVYVHADYFHVPTVWSHGDSHGANVYVSPDGALVKSSSATKYKTNIEHETDSIQGDRLLTIDPATWNDKFESEQLERYHETGVEPERKINMEGKRYYGIIAEDLVKAGLEELVARNEETDEVEGVEYSKIGVALIPIVRDLRNKLNEQAVEIERLKDKNK